MNKAICILISILAFMASLSFSNSSIYVKLGCEIASYLFIIGVLDGSYLQKSIKITIICFVTFQLSYALRYELIHILRISTNVLFYNRIETEVALEGTFSYLAKNYFYILPVIVLCSGHGFSMERVEIDILRLFRLSMLLAILSYSYYIANNLRLIQNKLIIYIWSNFQRYCYFAWFVFGYMFLGYKDKKVRVRGLIGMGMSFLFGLGAFALLQMRFLLLYQFFIIGLVGVVLSERGLRSLIRPKVLFLGLLVFVAFYVSTVLKFGIAKNGQIFNFRFIGIVLDQLIMRVSSSFTEMLALSNTAYGEYFASSRDQMLYEVLGGLPFGGTVFSSYSTGVTIDMYTNWIHSNAVVDSSFNVPLTTMIYYVYGNIISSIVLFCIGAGHAILFKLVSSFKHSPVSWGIVLILQVQFAFEGLRRENILGIVNDIIFYFICIAVCSKSKDVNSMTSKNELC